MNCRKQIFLILLICLSIFSLDAFAQAKKTRILFILDASSSMTTEWNKDYNKFSIARNILLQVVDSIYAINNEVEFAVRVYGADFPSQEKNCFDTRLVVPFNLQNTDQIKRSLLYINSIGSSPIAYSLSQAAFGEINQADKYDYSIIFITDGGESCNGDICKTYLELLQKKISITPYIIGLDNNELLKSYYDCLGKYVNVLEPNDIPKAVKLIVDENKPILDKPTQLNLKTVYSNTEIKKTDSVVPVKKDTVVKIKSVDTPKLVEVKKVDTIKKEAPPVVKKEEPKKIETPLVKKEINVFPKLKYLPSRQIRRKLAEIKLSKKPNNRAITFKIDEEIVVPPVIREEKKVLPKLRPFAPRHRFTYAFEAPNFRKYQQQRAVTVRIDVPPLKFDTVVVKNDNVPKSNPTPRTQTSVEGKKVEVSRELIPHQETMVQVFFINSFEKKKMYPRATPTIVVQESSTKKEVSKFVRTVTNDQPDLQPIAPGVYNFTVTGKQNLQTSEVRIEKNQINRIYISVSDGTLQFAYMGNLKRPVKEYQADVRIRFDNRGKNVKQNCDEVLPYLPGTYFVEVNTLPPTKFITVDLYFNAVTELNISEPGFLQISNLNKLGRVDLKEAQNNQYVTFFTMEVLGNFNEQKLPIQPGTYKAEFLVNPNVPALGTKELTFKVRSNQTTILELQ